MLKYRSFLCVLLLTWACGLLSAPSGHAQQMLFSVQLDTSPLIGLPSPPSPFALDFQLVDGSGLGDANNTVTLSNFQFGTDGSASGSPTLLGGAAGDLSSTVTLTDSAFFNAFSEEFTPGSLLTFDVNMTVRGDADGMSDQFSFAILEGIGTAIPTLGPGDALLTVDLSSRTVQTFASDLLRTNIVLGAPNVFNLQVIPEPGIFAFLVGGFSGLLMFWRRCNAHSPPVRTPRT